MVNWQKRSSAAAYQLGRRSRPLYWQTTGPYRGVLHVSATHHGTGAGATGLDIHGLLPTSRYGDLALPEIVSTQCPNRTAKIVGSSFAKISRNRKRAILGCLGWEAGDERNSCSG
jgi:hypothetical protein